MSNISSWKAYKLGLHVEWPFHFTIQDVRKFSELSNDFNKIHTDIDFAKSKGYESPLVHGMLLSSQISRLIGESLPDKNAILISAKIRFTKPCFCDDKLVFSAKLIHKSDSTYAMQFNFNIFKNQNIMSSGKVEAIWRPKTRNHIY